MRTQRGECKMRIAKSFFPFRESTIPVLCILGREQHQ